MTDTNGIKAVLSDGKKSVLINADITFDITEQNGVKSVHLADVIHTLLLQNLKTEDQAVLVPGQYRMAATISMVEYATATPLAEELDEANLASLEQTYEVYESEDL